MMKLFSLLFCGMSLCSCMKGQNPDPIAPVPGREVAFNVDMTDTKTVFGPLSEGSYPTLWSGDETVSVSYNWNEPVVSSTVSSSGASVTFSAEITPGDSAPHNFYAVSPSSAVTGISDASFVLEIPKTQTPGNNTPDEASQLIYASHISDSFDTNVSLHFSHLPAYGNMSVSLPDGVTGVRGYTIISGSPLSGTFSYDGAELAALEGSQHSIDLSTDKTGGIYFALAPCVMSGSYITLRLIADDGKTYTRTVDLAAKTLAFNRGRVTRFTINMSAVSPDGDKSAMSLPHPEVPGTKSGSDLECHFHGGLPSNACMRNYSYCFDRSRHCSMWVAWPLHAAWMGSADRTDAFGYDPVFVDNGYEADIGGGAYYSDGSYSHSRGHQMPSADRTLTDSDNRTTFYATNMTPQLQSLNAGAWVRLEELERNWCGDTLYIVTGPLFDTDSPSYAYDNRGKGKACEIPTHYWKVFLKVKSGVAQKDVTKCDSSELQCVGFIFSHDTSRGSRNVCSTDMRTVAQIESLTGFTLFQNVPHAPKSTYSATDWPGVVVMERTKKLKD